MRLQLIRHAMLMVELAGSRIVVDPMLDPAGARPAIANTPNHLPNPLTELPPDALSEIAIADAIIVTHLHQDHYDPTAARTLPHDRPLFCQPPDAPTLQRDGFTDVHPVATKTIWRGIEISRTGGQHGTGELAQRLGPVSGFVLAAPGEPVLYIAGDTVWCYDVEQAIANYTPDIVVVNAGAARFLTGDPITMNAEDVLRVLYAAPEGIVVAVHMDRHQSLPPPPRRPPRLRRLPLAERRPRPPPHPGGWRVAGVRIGLSEASGRGPTRPS